MVKTRQYCNLIGLNFKRSTLIGLKIQSDESWSGLGDGDIPLLIIQIPTILCYYYQPGSSSKKTDVM